jgi:hypothetical protein
MVHAAALAEKVAAFRHPKLAAVHLAGELNEKPTDSASLDELLQRLKTQLNKLARHRVAAQPGGNGIEAGTVHGAPLGVASRPAHQPRQLGDVDGDQPKRRSKSCGLDHSTAAQSMARAGCRRGPVNVITSLEQ